MTLTAHGTASIEALRSRVRGRLCRAGDEGYDDARAAWNLNAQLRPAVVVMAKTAMDVRDAVRFARRQRLGVAVMATGHGAAPCDGGLLVNTTGMRRVDIDPARRTARVSAGAMWVDVVREAAGADPVADRRLDLTVQRDARFARQARLYGVRAGRCDRA